MVHFNNDWDEVLAGEFDQEYYKRIRYFLKQEYAEQTVYPPMEYIFNALRLTPYSSVKAVILGQDPYHGPGQAHGLCFSVQPGVKVPPSLQNIYKELKSDLGIEPPKDGTLTKWAKQGVLMLNTTLTVRAGQANSHKNLGWTTFTDHVIEKLNDHEKPIVFLLWGGNARSKARSYLGLYADDRGDVRRYRIHPDDDFLAAMQCRWVRTCDLCHSHSVCCNGRDRVCQPCLAGSD